MTFYLWAMRSASVILFVFAVLVIAALAFSHLSMLIDTDPSPSFGPGTNLNYVNIILALAGALQSAAIPLFGSALLWRADRWLAIKTPAKGEAA